MQPVPVKLDSVEGSGGASTYGAPARSTTRSAPGTELRVDDVLRLSSCAAQLEPPRPGQRDLVPGEVAAGELRQHRSRVAPALIDRPAVAEAQPGGQRLDAPFLEQRLRGLLDQEHTSGIAPAAAQLPQHRRRRA